MTDTYDKSVRTMAEECVAVRLRLLTRAVTRIYNVALRPYGINISQLNVLAAVAYLGEARQQKVCQVLHMHKSTLSRDLIRMQDVGWIRSQGGQDGREVLLRVTSAGKALLAKAFPAWNEAQEEAKTLLGEKDIMSLGRSVLSLRSKSADRSK